jgi:hypothetical protein
MNVETTDLFRSAEKEKNQICRLHAQVNKITLFYDKKIADLRENKAKIVKFNKELPKDE